MKNGIDLLLILVLLATIGLLVYFGLGDVSTVVPPTSTLISTPTVLHRGGIGHTSGYPGQIDHPYLDPGIRHHSNEYGYDYFLAH